MQDYNTQLPTITLPEYGRNIQQLINYCKTIPDRDRRTGYAYTIIDIMADLYPDIAYVDNNKRILWDHLAMISNFELDIDYPFPITPKDTLQSTPKQLSSKRENITFRMYGKVMEQMVKRACEIENQEERISLFEFCANQMKRNFHKINKDADEDDKKIKNDLTYLAGREFADDICCISLMALTDLNKNEQYDPTKLVEPKKKKKKKK